MNIFDIYLEYEKTATLQRSTTKRINFSVTKDKFESLFEFVNSHSELKCVKLPSTDYSSIGSKQYVFGYISFSHNINPNEVFEWLNENLRKHQFTVLSSK